MSASRHALATFCPARVRWGESNGRNPLDLTCAACGANPGYLCDLGEPWTAINLETPLRDLRRLAMRRPDEGQSAPRGEGLSLTQAAARLGLRTSAPVATTEKRGGNIRLVTLGHYAAHYALDIEIRVRRKGAGRAG